MLQQVQFAQQDLSTYVDMDDTHVTATLAVDPAHTAAPPLSASPTSCCLCGHHNPELFGRHDFVLLRRHALPVEEIFKVQQPGIPLPCQEMRQLQRRLAWSSLTLHTYPERRYPSGGKWLRALKDRSMKLSILRKQPDWEHKGLMDLSSNAAYQTTPWNAANSCYCRTSSLPSADYLPVFSGTRPSSQPKEHTRAIADLAPLSVRAHIQHLRACIPFCMVVCRAALCHVCSPKGHPSRNQALLHFSLIIFVWQWA